MTNKRLKQSLNKLQAVVDKHEKKYDAQKAEELKQAYLPSPISIERDELKRENMTLRANITKLQSVCDDLYDVMRKQAMRVLYVHEHK